MTYFIEINKPFISVCIKLTFSCHIHAVIKSRQNTTSVQSVMM